MKGKTRSARRLSPFNLIEVTLAIGIVAVGMAGLMALFPIGFNATRDAIGESYSADTADQLLHVMAYQVKQSSADWNSLLGVNDTDGIIQNQKPTPVPDDSAHTGKAFPIFDNIYKTSTPGVYYIESKTGNNLDFAAHARVWKTKTHNISSDPTLPPQFLDWDIAATINVELSWPAGKPYARRTKRYYQLTVFNPNPPATP